MTSGRTDTLLQHIGRLAARRLLQGSETRRHLRAVRVLECIGTKAACQVLDKLARGTPEARLTREAKAASRRLTR